MKLFFHLRKSPWAVRRDDEGQEFQTLEEAYATVCREIPDLVAEYLRQRTDAMGFAFEITDENDMLIMEIPFREMIRPEPNLDLEGSQRALEALELTAAGIAGAGGAAARGPDTFKAFVHSTFPCMFLDEKGTISAVNTAFEQTCSLKPRKMIGRTFFDIFPDREENDGFAGRRRLQAALKNIPNKLEADSYTGQRYDVRGPDGEWNVLYWDVDNWPVFDLNGGFYGIAHCGRPTRESADRLARNIVERMTSQDI